MKHLRYKGGAHVRKFSADDLKKLEISEDGNDDGELVWDKRQGGVLELKNDSAARLMELYPDSFEEVDKEQAEQLQLDPFTPATVANDPDPSGESPTPITPAGATRTRSSTRTG